ncbi:phage tail tape measure protein [Alicyclobacillus shizuokensis]|uniref:phage tail tape measure protein n=1 Tax=Alicyclobacillus shizuokensis TaxID=392014 RepID=UPI00083085B9|nr:phage tail tape measure protein [Alicyclobacillus shizuokensis]
MPNEEIGNLVAKVSMDSMGFQEGVAQLRRQLSVVKSEFKAAAANLGEFGTETDKLRLQTESLTKQIEIQRGIVQTLEQAYAKSAAEKGEDAKQTQQLAIKLNNARAALGEMESELRQANSQIEQQASGMGKLGTAMEQTRSRLASLGAIVKTSLVWGAVYEGINAVTGGLKGIITTSMDFESEMSKVKALSGATGDQFEQLRQTAIKLGADSVFSASQAAQGMTNLAAAGFNAQQIIDAMPGILNAAAAAGEDFASVSDIMISAMNDFGLKANDMSHIADDLAAAANASSISISDIGVSLKYVGPVAHSAGLSLEEISAALAILGNNGIKADTAGTSLRMGLQRLVSPPKAAAEELDNLGVKVTDTSGKMLPLSTIIGQLHDKFQGMSQSQRLAAASAIFGAESMSAWLTLIDKGSGQLDKLTNSFVHSNGAAKQMADTMNDNLKGSIQQMEGAFESLSIKIGQAVTPALRTVIDGITRVVQSLTNGSALKGLFPPELITSVQYFGKEIKESFGLLKNALGDGKLGKQVYDFFAPFQSLGSVAAKVIEDIGSGIYAMTSLLTGDKAGFEHIMDALGVPPAVQQSMENEMSLLKQAYQVVMPAFKQIAQQIVTFFKNNWPEIAAAVKNAMQVIDSVMNLLWPVIKVVVIGTLKTIMDMIKEATNMWMDTIKIFADLFTGNWSGLWHDITDLLKNALGLAWNLFSFWIGGKILGLLKAFAPALKAPFKAAMDGLSDVASSALSGIRNLFGKAFDWVVNNTVGRVKSLVSGISDRLSGMRDTVSSALDHVKSAFSSAWSAVYNNTIGRVKTLVSSIQSRLGSLPSVVSSLFGKIRDAGVSAFEKLVSSASSRISSLRSTVQSRINSLLSYIAGLPGKMASYGSKMISSLVSGFKSIHIPLPHFSFGEGHRKIAGINVPYPTVSVNWYATGGIFNQPSVIGVGEAGPEAVVPLSKLPDLLAQAMQKAFQGGKTGVDVLSMLFSGGETGAGQWGRNLASMLAQGLQSQTGVLANAANAAATAIEDYLGWHSPTRKGPGKTSDQWGSNLTKTIASGISKSKSSASKAAKDVAQALIDGLKSKVAPYEQTINQLKAKLKFDQNQGNTAAATKDASQLASAYQQAISKIQSAMKSVNAEIKKLNPKTHASDIEKLKKQYAAWGAEVYKDKDALHALKAEAQTDVAQNLLNKVESNMDSVQKQIDILQAEKQYLSDSGKSISGVDKSIAGEYQKEIKTIQSSIKSLQSELKKLDPKTQGDLVKQVKDKIADLNAQLWQTKDALAQLQQQSIQNTVTNLLNKADTNLAPLQQQLNVLQAEQQYLSDAGKDTSSIAKQIGNVYNQEIKSIQSSIQSLQAELKKLNPKTQADLVQQVKQKIADLNSELWQTKDALVQINAQAANAFKTATDLDLQAISTALQSKLDAFDQATQAMDAQFQAQLAALQQEQTQDDRANQQKQWDEQMADLQHQLAVAQMMNDPETVKQVQAQIDDLNQQIADQQKQWAIQDQEQAIQLQQQQYDQQRALMRDEMEQEIQLEQQKFQALQTQLVQAIQTGQLTLAQANAAWLQAIKDTGDQAIQLQIQAQAESQDELNSWVQSYVDVGEKYGQGLAQGLVAGLNSMLGAVQAAAAKLASAASAAIGAGKAAVATATASLKVPAMASGGILTGPTLALAGEAGPEAVLPLNDSTLGRLAAAIVAQMGGARGGQQQPINIDVHIGNDVVASYVWDYGLQQTVERQRKG